MIKVIYKGEKVLELKKIDIEDYLFFRKISFKKPKDLVEIDVRKWKEFGDFKVYRHYGGIWIVKDFEVYSLSFIDLMNLLAEDKELEIVWEETEKKEIFWLDNVYTQFLDFDKLEPKYEVFADLFELMKKIMSKKKG